MAIFSDFKLRVRKAVNEGRITKKGIATAAVLILLLYTSSVMMFIGMNFWLWSFTAGIKRNYAAMLLPSLLWCAFFLFTLLCIIIYNAVVHRCQEEYMFWFCRKGISFLVLIALFDSLTGLTGMYATVHVPQILQTALISTGPVWTFLLAFIIHPHSQPKWTWHLIFVMIFIFGGVTLAIIPQTQINKKNYFSIPWTFIYLIGTILYPVYNVLQGKFLFEFQMHCRPFTRKIIMLTTQASIQVLFVIIYFPVDFSPFYGSCHSPRESWENLLKSMKCVHECYNNATYMLIYVFGFWIRHIVFAQLNEYSPAVAAVASMLTQPINSFFLLTIPSWNVYGAKNKWAYMLGCFLCLLTAKLLFATWYVLYKNAEENSSLPLMEDEEKDIDARVTQTKEIEVSVTENSKQGNNNNQSQQNYI